MRVWLDEVERRFHSTKEVSKVGMSVINGRFMPSFHSTKEVSKAR